MSICSPRIRLLLIAGTLLLSPAGNLRAGDAGPTPGTYRIVDGKVDGGTYAGWFVYSLSCHMCHGQDATGTEVAPDLRESLKTMTQAEFANQVLARYRLFGTPGDAAPDVARIGQRRGVAAAAWRTRPTRDAGISGRSGHEAACPRPLRVPESPLRRRHRPRAPRDTGRVIQGISAQPSPCATEAIRDAGKTARTPCSGST